ncbi:synaptic vesicular amine transporter-like [Lingula anatina]|uniref:Synaptic vesicular amine transporter-like n=1 Tax=Lingula anatina TaxID=7574 RepID=A0A1S3HNG2_LINAN|nr:synaptic vesicular amine transporter-like [Lingula anatina]|eukprot:XP_013387585.1 synaptic vesicular amine transporter-like [Lingula anatina]
MESKDTKVDIELPKGCCNSCCHRLRRSRHLVVFILFMAVLMDVVLTTSIDPIVPDVIHRIMGDADANTSVPMVKSSSPVNNTVRDEKTVGNENGFTETSRGMEIGIVVGAKPFAELFFNLVVGCLVERVGHRYPMILGFGINSVATAVFAFGTNFPTLVMARVLQAIGSSMSVVAGLVCLASAIPDDEQRVKANSMAFMGISIGVIIGYPFGSATYQFLGQASPFLILVAFNILSALLRLWIVTPEISKVEDNCSNIIEFARLMKDPYVLIALGCSFVSNFGLGIFLGTGPAWMLYKLHAEQWTVGVVLAVAVFFHLTAQYITGAYSMRFGRWLFCMVGLMLSAIGMGVYPFVSNVWEVLGPEIIVRIGQGTVLSVISPLLGHLADIRHHGNYGGVYGLYTTSYNLGLSIGPVCGGSLVKVLTFDWLYRVTAVIMFLYAFTSLAFRDTPAVQQGSPPKQVLVSPLTFFFYELIFFNIPFFVIS